MMWGEGSFGGGIKIHGSSSVQGDESESPLVSHCFMWKPGQHTPTLLNSAWASVWCNARIRCLCIILLFVFPDYVYLKSLGCLRVTAIKFCFDEQRKCLISPPANKKEDVLLNVKMRAINDGILAHGLVVKRFLNMASLSFCDRFPFFTSTMHASLLSRPPQRKATSSWSQEEHLSAAAGCRLPLLSTHGPRARERHSQLLGLCLWCYFLSPYLSVEMCKGSTCVEYVAQQYVVCDFQRFVLHHQIDWRKLP